MYLYILLNLKYTKDKYFEVEVILDDIDAIIRFNKADLIKLIEKCKETYSAIMNIL